MSEKIEFMRLCRVLQSDFSCICQSESRTQPCVMLELVMNLFFSVSCA